MASLVLPTEPAEALAMLTPEQRAQIEPLLGMVPEETQRAVLASLPQVIAAVEGNDYPAFAALVETWGFGMFAPMIWEMVIAHYPR
jgi:hypothetical protein